MLLLLLLCRNSKAVYEDSYKHKGMRRALVEEIARKGIGDERVLEAMRKVPRHLFMDSAFLEHAYQDKAFPIGEGQTISQPYTVAYQTELLDVQVGHKILEIGTGSGYQACVLLAMGGKVFSVEYNKKLFERTKKFLSIMNYQNIQLKHGDGSLGWSSEAPFDRILLTAGAPSRPDVLIDQLAVGGKLVAPIGDLKKQKMMRFTRLSDGSYMEEIFGDFAFVPLFGKNGWQS